MANPDHQRRRGRHNSGHGSKSKSIKIPGCSGLHVDTGALNFTKASGTAPGGIEVHSIRYAATGTGHYALKDGEGNTMCATLAELQVLVAQMMANSQSASA